MPVSSSLLVRNNNTSRCGKEGKTRLRVRACAVKHNLIKQNGGGLKMGQVEKTKIYNKKTPQIVKNNKHVLLHFA